MAMNMAGEADDRMLFSTLLNSTISTECPGGEQKVRRRRRKAREEGESAESKKRRLTEEQVKYLETSFGKERKLESGRKVHLASELGIDPKQVAVWFQNRRARSKSKQLEEEYMKLRSAHEMTVVQKCHLEAEILKLKDQLSDAQKEITKLSGCGSDGVSCAGGGGGGELSSSSPSPSTSFSVDTHQPFFAAPEDFAYMSEYSNYMWDWVNLYGGGV